LLLMLALGAALGVGGLGGVSFADYRFSFAFGTIALVLILFDGGLNTPLARIASGVAPAATLATAGVAGTATLVALFVRWFGFSWPQAFLVGAIVSSTDAAAVFAILRNSGVQLRKR